MKNDPIKLMYHEHEVIMQLEEVIGSLEKYWISDPDSYKNIAKQILIFCSEYADGFHHRKEEEILFPAIYGHHSFVLHGMIDEFNDHHESFREYAMEINDALESEEYDVSYSVLKRYFNDLTDHIAAENEELFVLAQNLLDEEELETIYFKFMDVDMEWGMDRKAALEKMPDEWRKLIPANT